MHHVSDLSLVGCEQPYLEHLLFLGSFPPQTCEDRFQHPINLIALSDKAAHQV